MSAADNILRKGLPNLNTLSETTYQEEPLQEKTRRYRRNVLAIATGVIAISLFDGIDLEAFEPMGLPIAEQATLSIAAMVLVYNVILFAIYSAVDWNIWSLKVRDQVFPKIRMLFGLWPPAVEMVAPEAYEETRKDYRRRDLLHDLPCVSFYLRSAPAPANQSVWHSSAYLEKVQHARWRVLLFFIVDIGLPLTAASWAGAIVVCHLW